MAFNLQRIRIAIFTGSSILFGLLISFFSKAEWIIRLKYLPLGKTNVLLYFILAPIVLVFNICQTAIAFIEIFNSSSVKKDIIGFLVELVKTIQTIISLSWKTPLLLAAPLVVPISLVAVIAIDALFHIGCCLFHAWQWYKMGREEDKLLIAKHSVSLAVSTLATIGLGIMFLSGVGPAALLPIGIITALIIAVGGTLAILFGSYTTRRIRQGYQQLPGNVDDDGEDEEHLIDPRIVVRVTEEPVQQEERRREPYPEPTLISEELQNKEPTILSDSITFSKTESLHLYSSGVKMPSQALQQTWRMKPSSASPLFFREAEKNQLNTNEKNNRMRLKTTKTAFLLSPP